MTATWSFGGTDLISAGAYKVTVIDDAQGSASPRGDNPEIPQREGRLHVNKYFEQRRLSLGMAVYASSVATFETNLNTLKALFGKRTRQTLSRIMADATTHSVSAEVIGDLNLVQTGPTSAKMTVDFLLADPFFRLSTKTTVTSTIIAATHSFTVTNGGNVQDRSAVITLTGGSSGLYYPKITNATNGVYCGYNANIGDGIPIVFDTANWTVTQGGSGNLIVNAYHSGDSYFMVLEPGANTITVEASAYTGATIKFEFYAPFL